MEGGFRHAYHVSEKFCLTLCRYVKIIEGDTADVLTLHQRGEDGRYDKRTSSIRAASRKDLFLPPHLYGQLSKHSAGFQMLLNNGSLDIYIGVSSLLQQYMYTVLF